MEYDIRKVYRDIVVDIRNLPYPQAGQQRDSTKEATAYEIAQQADTEVYELNPSASPLLWPFTFTTLDGATSYRLPNAPLVRVTGIKDIVRSKPVGRDFSVKELITVEDWDIKIRGVAFNEEITNSVGKRGYPFDTLRAMVELFKTNATMRVENKILEAYGITQVVVRRFDVPATPGLQNAFAYELDCYSDSAEELVLIRNV